MSSLLDKIKKNSTIKSTTTVKESTILLDGFEVPTDIPAINIALSGRLNGGLTSGITIFAGESRRFKSMYSLYLASAYLRHFPESICLFYDSEFGSPVSYFEKVGIDPTRVLHSPISNIEELKHDIVNQLSELKRDDRVIILLDSLGNLASLKELEDTMDGKNVADMTRAKSLKSMFRQITPTLTIKDIPMIIVNHTYKEIGLYPREIMGGGTGAMYSPNAVFFIGKRQEKDGKELIGNDFVISVEKSRTVKEKSKISVEVSFESGINKYSALLDMAIEMGRVVKPNMGWYSRILDINSGEVEEKKWRRKDTNCDDFWDVLLKDADFQKSIENMYKLD